MTNWDKAYQNLTASNPEPTDAHDDTATDWFWYGCAAVITLVWAGWLAVWALELVQ